MPVLPCVFGSGISGLANPLHCLARFRRHGQAYRPGGFCMPCIDTGRISLFFTEAGSGEVPVLLLHELGGSSESWREVIPLLAADRRVIAMDMRCAGRSESRRAGLR